MITAIVFVKADVARIPEVAEADRRHRWVSEVYSVTGQIDLIALVRVSTTTTWPGRRRPAQQGPRREGDRDPHRVPRLLPARPRGGVLARPRLTGRPPAGSRRTIASQCRSHCDHALCRQPPRFHPSRSVFAREDPSRAPYRVRAFRALASAARRCRDCVVGRRAVPAVPGGRPRPTRPVPTGPQSGTTTTLSWNDGNASRRPPATRSRSTTRPTSASPNSQAVTTNNRTVRPDAPPQGRTSLLAGAVVDGLRTRGPSGATEIVQSTQRRRRPPSRPSNDAPLASRSHRPLLQWSPSPGAVGYDGRGRRRRRLDRRAVLRRRQARRYSRAGRRRRPSVLVTGGCAPTSATAVSTEWSDPLERLRRTRSCPSQTCGPTRRWSSAARFRTSS